MPHHHTLKIDCYIADAQQQQIWPSAEHLQNDMMQRETLSVVARTHSHRPIAATGLKTEAFFAFDQ